MFGFTRFRRDMRFKCFLCLIFSFIGMFHVVLAKLVKLGFVIFFELNLTFLFRIQGDYKAHIYISLMCFQLKPTFLEISFLNCKLQILAD